ncbi:MAG: hypothetical protein RQ729_13345, partial [Wenzhouxiangellaceae bacterium]|nr:hypothetical protein [Wenzhouxiangellaceae bacterium]
RYPAVNDMLADRRMQRVVALGSAIRRAVEEAELEQAGQLAAERRQELVALFGHHQPDPDDDTVAYWMQEIVRDDQVLLDALDQLREQLELELGAQRKASGQARAYADVAGG